MVKHNFRELKSWKRARRLVKAIYLQTQSFPKTEQFGLTAQIRRCAISIPSNLAEGCGRDTDAQMLHFLDIAHGSACELETQLLLAFDVNYIAKENLATLLDEVHEIQRMMLGFKRYVKQNKSQSAQPSKV